MTKEAPKAHLTAPIWNWGVYYTKAIEAAAKGTFKELVITLVAWKTFC
jgi:basic membrane protein A